MALCAYLMAWICKQLALPQLSLNEYTVNVFHTYSSFMACHGLTSPPLPAPL
jgi:hypothetical protein